MTMTSTAIFGTPAHRVHNPSVMYVRDVMAALGVGMQKAYQIIRQINAELNAEGYITINGRVSEARFYEKIYTGKGGPGPRMGKLAKLGE